MKTHEPTRDPVCRMRVDPGSTDHVSIYKGRSFYFCAEGCKNTFERNPEKFLKPRGFFRRFLDRLADSNEQTFGPKGPSCCH